MFIMDRMAPLQIKNYLEKQAAESGESVKNLIKTWKDYLNMAIRVGVNVQDSVIYRARKLMQRHNEMIKEIEAKDLILRAGKYQSWKCTFLANGVFSLWIMGYVSRMFLTRTEFFASLVSSYGQEYVDTLMSYTPNWMFPVLFVVTFIGGVLGALLGKAVLKKHFESGIA